MYEAYDIHDMEENTHVCLQEVFYKQVARESA
jgi:hypothetical protein